MTLIVNLYGGPGTGKSTTAAGVFHRLKSNGVNTELAHEFAKDLTWEKRITALQFQPYVIGKQMYRIHRLLGQVDVVITDSPILLGWHYAPYDEVPGFFDMVREYNDRWNTLDVFLSRDPVEHPYNPKGRNQSEEEAKRVDESILTVLNQTNTPHVYVRVNGLTVDRVTDLIYERLT